MKKKLLNLFLALVIVLALLPMKSEALEAIKTEDCSQHLTNNILRPEDLTLDGIPFYNLTLEESMNHLPNSLVLSSSLGDVIYHDKDVGGRSFRSYGIGISESMEDRIGGPMQYDDSSVLNRYQFGFARKIEENDPWIGVNTGIRNIVLGDSTKSTLQKIGISSEGADYITKTLLESSGKAACFIIQDDMNTTSEIRFYDETRGNFQVVWRYKADGDIQAWLHFEDNKLTCVSLENFGTTAPNISNSPANFPQMPNSKTEYLYDVKDLGENMNLPVDLLDNVTNANSAADAVKQMVNDMTSEQKSSATGVDLATLYAETATAKAASKEVEGGEVIISAASVADLESKAEEAVSAVETALVNGGVTTARYLASTVTLTTDETGEITIKIDPDILTTDVDKIRVETPTYALTLKTADLAEDLTEVLTITAEDVGSGFAPGKGNSKTSVKINLPKGRTTNPVTISLSSDSGATTYQAVVKTDGTATASKYNPATTTMDGKINTSGTYTVQTNEKNFTDISNKSAEMQKAILYLTSKGIINGTSATQFSPDGTINRQQIAALLMRALGKVDNTAKPTFTDVLSSSSFYHAIASSQKHKVINGYSDNTFRGANVISRVQIVTVAGRVLTTEMNYKTPSNASTYLAKYSDTVPEYAREMIALATRENLVVYRTDGTFSGAKNMTRGDAAIILYRLFQKIW